MTIALAVLCKAILASAIAVLAEIMRRRAKPPETVYALWATVLAVLLIPSIIAIPLPQTVSATLTSIQSAWLGWHSAASDSVLGFNKGESIWARPFSEAGYAIAIAVGIWVLGGGLILWREVHRARLVGRLVRFAIHAPPVVMEHCAAIAGELGIRRCPLVMVADGVFSPFLFHPFSGRARVVLPLRLLKTLGGDSLEVVLRHELMHLRRHDSWRRRLELVVVALWWWLPTSWLARRRLRELEELCTDAAVLRSNPGCAKTYARALLDTEEFLSGVQPCAWNLGPAFASSASLKARIASIATYQPSRQLTRRRHVIHALVLSLLVLGLFSAGIAPSSLTDPSTTVVGDFDAQRASPDTEFAKNGRADALDEMADARIDSICVQNSDRTLVLKLATDESAQPFREIRLVKVSEDGIRPQLWKIDNQSDGRSQGEEVSARELARIFAHLSPDHEIIDSDGTLHSYLGSVKALYIQPQERGRASTT